MSTRVLAAVERIANEHEGGRILVVSHGGPIRAIHGAALGMDVEDYRRIRPVEPNARLSAVRIEDGRFTSSSRREGSMNCSHATRRSAESSLSASSPADLKPGEGRETVWTDPKLRLAPPETAASGGLHQQVQG
jgi:broad specificity phosphatase PhoE